MLKLIYAPRFIRQFKKLPAGLQEEIITKIQLFNDPRNHALLGVHKLHGQLKRYSGFSIDFRNRIVFEYLSKHEVALLAVGDHDIYQALR